MMRSPPGVPHSAQSATEVFVEVIVEVIISVKLRHVASFNKTFTLFVLAAFSNVDT